jgi:RNA polymerase sigma factor (sigma-70 family)
MFNERQVVSSILRGDMRAFDLLVEQYERLVFHVVNRLINEREDKEDVCQEVFIKVHKSLPGFQFQSKLSTWIARIAYFTAINHLKRNKTEQMASISADVENYHFTNNNPEQLLTKKEIGVYIDKLIAQLPEKYRIVITLYHLNEFSCLEIEEITGMPEGTVKNYLFRARKLLKEKIQVYLKSEMI